MSRLTALIEQTSYLLDKQHEAQAQTANIFENVLAFIEQSAEKKSDAQKDRLLEVYELLAKRAEILNTHAQEDIDFLKDQLKALEQISQVKDPKIAAEMLEAIIDEDEEIPNTVEFKQELDDELEQSRQVLTAVTDDIKDAIERDDISETEILIESMLDENLDEDDFEDEDDEDDFYDDEEEDEDDEDEDNYDRPKKRGGCGDCSGGCGPKGCGGCSLNSDESDNIFSFMSKYDRDLNDDLEDEEEDGCCSDDSDEDEGDECCKK